VAMICKRLNDAGLRILLQ